MDASIIRLPYRQTGAFSRIVLDYIDQSPSLQPFFKHRATLQGIESAIAERQAFPTDRQTLVKVLQEQYADISHDEKTKQHITSLLDENCFTVTTAHQNNVFTGPLYFIYKIFHAIHLAGHLEKSFPGKKFVPVYYMGSEDADFEELNHIHLAGEKLEWKTGQHGAVGRMKVDQALTKLIDRIEGQLGVQPFGKEWITALREAYTPGRLIQQATFHFVNRIFKDYGLIILIADHPLLKKNATSIFSDDIFQQQPSTLVSQTAASLDQAGYNVQASPREINLFYLRDGLRERIEKHSEDEWKVVKTEKVFTREELLKELQDHPEYFSPNVILRGIYQECILPNVAFIGGGGEIAYWLQFKSLFDKYGVPFPVLVLRNSFLLVEKKWKEKINQLGFTPETFFNDENKLMNLVIAQKGDKNVQLNGSILEVDKMYDSFKQQASVVDPTLSAHVEALKVQAHKRLEELQKKMIRAEKRKYGDLQRQINTIKSNLFPGNGLQERHDNILYYLAKYGDSILRVIERASLDLEHEFVIINLDGSNN